MNFLAHGLASLDDPYETAGVAVPDWLGLTRPRLRCRSRHAAPWQDDADPRIAAMARGVMRHHAEDDWFHQTSAFGFLSIELARRVRQATGDADGMRPSFLGHILVELLLDAAIMEREPATADRYYAALAQVDSREVARTVGAMNVADASPLATIIDRFRELRFLYDYADDQRLLYRLNQIMRRVGLSELPTGFARMLPSARQLTLEHREALLTPPATSGAASLAPLSR